MSVVSLPAWETSHGNVSDDHAACSGTLHSDPLLYCSHHIPAPRPSCSASLPALMRHLSAWVKATKHGTNSICVTLSTAPDSIATQSSPLAWKVNNRTDRSLASTVNWTPPTLSAELTFNMCLFYTRATTFPHGPCLFSQDISVVKFIEHYFL